MFCAPPGHCRGRVAAKDFGEEPRGAAAFLGAVRGQVYARATGTDGPYDLECDIGELVPGLLEAAAKLNGRVDPIRTAAQGPAGVTDRQPRR